MTPVASGCGLHIGAGQSSFTGSSPISVSSESLLLLLLLLISSDSLSTNLPLKSVPEEDDYT